MCVEGKELSTFALKPLGNHSVTEGTGECEQQPVGCVGPAQDVR